MHHGPGSRHEISLSNMVPLFFSLHHATNELRQLLIRSSAAHQLVQIMIPDGEQAGANLAIRGDANAAAMSAERVRHGRDNSDLSDAVIETISSGGFAALVWNLD